MSDDEKLQGALKSALVKAAPAFMLALVDSLTPGGLAGAVERVVDKAIERIAAERRALNTSEMHQRSRRKSMLAAFGAQEAARVRHRELTGREPGVEAPLP